MTCKICKSCYPNRRRPVKLKKLKIMKILGIGNAIVDVICKVNENFIKQNSLTKSTMKLVNEDEFKKILSNFCSLIFFKFNSG